MKICRKGALALVTWLLLYPPWNDKKQVIDPSLPFREWYQVGTFETSGECRAESMKTLEQMDNQIMGTNADSDDEQLLRHDARCIASDDPRLQPK
jgi:hypothetical protein